LIDEIDKADIEFPNDLLQELDKMEFFVYETQQVIKAKQRPIIIITSNNEKELPDAFLRRCFFHYIKFPSKVEMAKIIDVHHPNVKQDLLKQTLEVFFDLRELNGIKKKPSTSELIDWLKLLISDDIAQDVLLNNKSDIVPLFGALLKNEQDVSLIEKLAFMSRRNG
jgi:MoxR-like ATPase